MPFFVEEAKKKRACTVCENVIRKGETHLRFEKGSGMYTVTGNVCRLCMERFMGEIALAESVENNVIELNFERR